MRYVVDQQTDLPAHEDESTCKEKEKTILVLLTREDYNRVELENVINKICTNQEIEENQIKPIVDNDKIKKRKTLILNNSMRNI